MKIVAWLLGLTLLAGVGAPAEARGQEEERGGMGLILDFIYKLSGPTMIGPGASGYLSLGESWRARLSLAWLTAVSSDDVIEPDGARVSALAFKPSLEFDAPGPVDVISGLSLRRFGGDADDGVWNLSIPVHVQGRIPLLADADGPRLYLRLVGGGEYFTEFDPDAFFPVTTGVSTDGGELTWVATVGVDWVLR